MKYELIYFTHVRSFLPGPRVGSCSAITACVISIGYKVADFRSAVSIGAPRVASKKVTPSWEVHIRIRHHKTPMLYMQDVASLMWQLNNSSGCFANLFSDKIVSHRPFMVNLAVAYQYGSPIRRKTHTHTGVQLRLRTHFLDSNATHPIRSSI